MEGSSSIRICARPRTLRVHVCGDATPISPQLSPIATYEGDIVGRNIVEGPKHMPDYAGLVTSVYTVPALAAAGLTESAVRQQGSAIDVHVNDMRDWFSARSYAETVAWSKVIVERASDRIRERISSAMPARSSSISSNSRSSSASPRASSETFSTPIRRFP
jgi:pyruvate/2-oxoglutarate dehydrogenase complex dihydrolipoamide dehydrogenase (E3) component